MTRRIGRRDSDASPTRTRREGLAGQHAGQHPHRRAGVAGVERRGGRTQMAQSSSHQSDGGGGVGRRSTPRPRRHASVDWQSAPRRIVAQVRRPVGERREQGVAMRDRLVAGHAQPAADAAGRRQRWRRWQTSLADLTSLGLTSRKQMVFMSPGPIRRMPLNPRHVVRLEFTSAFEMLDFVQVVSDHMAAQRRSRRRRRSTGSAWPSASRSSTPSSTATATTRPSTSSSSSKPTRRPSPS